MTTQMIISGIILSSMVMVSALLVFINKREVKHKVDKELLLKEAEDYQYQVLQSQELLGQEREKNKTLLSQKKSSVTRLGQISEHLIPFLKNCPYDPKSMQFLGNPIDFVVFDFDDGSITFLEIKSGNSRISKRQKTVKNIVKTGRVFYDEIRINEKGVHVKGRTNKEDK